MNDFEIKNDYPPERICHDAACEISEAIKCNHFIPDEVACLEKAKKILQEKVNE